MAITCRVHGPMPGIDDSAAIDSSRSLPGPSVRSTAQRVHEGGERLTTLRRHREVRRLSTRPGSGQECVSPPPGSLTGSPCRVDETSGVGLGGGRRDLLAEHRAQRHLGTVDAPRHPSPWGLHHEWGEHCVAAQMTVDRDRVGVEVEEPATARDRRREVTHVAQHGATVDVVGRRREFDDTGTVGQSKGAAIGRPAHFFNARHRRRRQVTEEIVGTERLAKRQSQHDGGRRLAMARGPLARERSIVGDDAYTACTVSLNCRTLEKPAAKATSVIARAVVSMRMRAVCARWARAMAMGPAPISFCRTRSSWRTL